MNQKRIIIVSQYSLFDQGLRAALSQQPDVEVIGVYRELETAYVQAKTHRPDVFVLIAGPEITRDSAFSLLEEVTSSIIRISPTDGSMQVYRREQVDRASVDDLMMAIQATATRLKAGRPIDQDPGQIVPNAGDLPTQPRRAGMKHIIIVAVLVVIATVLVTIGLQNAPILPREAGQEAASIDGLFGLHLQVIAFLFSLIVVFTVYSVVVFRRKAGDTEDGLHTHGNARLEIVWTVIPLITVLYFGFLGAQQLRQITTPGPDELIVNVTGQQFAWVFDYPDHGVTSAELNLPRDRKVLLKLNSKDVIHSFWVPEFRVKQDAVPGMTTELRITPTQVGDYKLLCAELCGTAHYAMLANVHVLEASDFDAWITQQAAAAQAAAAPPPSQTGGGTAGAGATGAELGAQLAQSQGCLGCHSVDGSQLVGPTWLGIYGAQENLEAGGAVTVDEEYLRGSILEPNAQITQGFPANVMPSIYRDSLSIEQIDALIEYIKSLAE